MRYNREMWLKVRYEIFDARRDYLGVLMIIDREMWLAVRLRCEM